MSTIIFAGWIANPQAGIGFKGHPQGFSQTGWIWVRPKIGDNPLEIQWLFAQPLVGGPV